MHNWLCDYILEKLTEMDRFALRVEGWGMEISPQKILLQNKPVL